jgi:hypothetical protein
MGSFNVSQGTAGSRPAYGGGGARSINGIVCPEWDASNDTLAGSLSVSDITSSWFVVGLVDTLSVYRSMIGGNASGAFQFGTEQTTGRLSAFAQDVGGGNAFGQCIVVVNVPFVAGIAATGTGMTCFLAQNGLVALSRSTGAGATTLTAARTLQIGVAAAPGASDPWDGLIGEVINYDRTLTDAELRRNLAYLAWKWGIDSP